MSNLYDLIKNEVYLYHERLGCLIDSDSDSDNELNKSLFKESERVLKILCSILLGDEILEKHSDDFSGFLYHILMENLYNITN